LTGIQNKAYSRKAFLTVGSFWSIPAYCKSWPLHQEWNTCIIRKHVCAYDTHFADSRNSLQILKFLRYTKLNIGGMKKHF